MSRLFYFWWERMDFACLRASHGGCDSPPDYRQEPPFESILPCGKRSQSNQPVLRCNKRCESAVLRNKKSSEKIRAFLLLVGADGFEPSKSLTTDLQSAPFGHSGTLPQKNGAGGRT